MKPKASSTQAKLITLTGSGLESKQKNTIESFSQKLMFHPNQEEAATMVAEQAGWHFDQSEDGKQLAENKLLQSELDSEFKSANKRRNTLEDKLNGTKQYIKCIAAPEDGEAPIKASFWRWSGRDQASMVMLCLCLLAAMVMGATNVYSNLMSSGQPVFLDNPWMAISISMLVPAGSCAIKFIANFFEFNLSKKRYALIVYSSVAITLLLWTIFFAQEFTGVTSEIDWDALGEESSDKGAWLVWVQIVAEILVAAALFLAAEDISLKYSPESYRENPEYINALDAFKKHQSQHSALREQRGQNHASIIGLEARRQAYINDCLAEFMARRTRFNSFNQL